MWDAIRELMEQFEEGIVVLDADGEIAVVNRAAREKLARREQGGGFGDCRVVRMGRARSVEVERQQLDEVASALPVVLSIRNRTKYLYISQAHEKVFGDGPESFYKNVRAFLERVHPDDYEPVREAFDSDLAGNPHQYRCQYQHASGEWRKMHVRVLPYQDPDSGDLLIASLVEDVTEVREGRKQQGERRLLGSAEFRAALGQWTEEWIGRPGSPLFAVAFIDLARFRVVNESFGYSEGDRILEEVSERIEQGLPGQALIASLGLDLFAVMVRPFEGREQAETAIRQVLLAISAPIEVGETTVRVMGRAGLAFPRNIECTADALLRDADAALQLAKQTREPLVVSNVNRAVKLQELAMLEFDLERALEQNEFFFEFQPVFDPNSGEVKLLEALVRWRHPRLGVISPTSFISLAEDTGLVLRLDMKGLERLAGQLEYWHSVEPAVADLPVSVNISGRHFPSFVMERQFHELLKKPAMKNSRIIFEITESVFVESNSRTAAALERLRAEGVAIWLDDFGEGYSSLRYLAHFPVDGIKISETFVKNCVQEEKSRVILSALLALARGLGVQMVVEGVENQRQFETLRDMGFEALQGYYLSKPLGVKEIRQLIESGVEEEKARPRSA
ncbi:MAG: GGDEF and EAL domain-containing protein [Bryobacter sp.]|jgi:diguanylate cyclase (GGDEF)-like protein/PAS domain S-box-containing protein|nr:GGDEF and EAL domain-containing protein [Bryobacter sp. CoA8 C33]